jgi:hypothetical protein
LTPIKQNQSFVEPVERIAFTPKGEIHEKNGPSSEAETKFGERRRFSSWAKIARRKQSENTEDRTEP